MKRISLRTWLAGAVLGVALAMTLSFGVSYADCPTGGGSETCSTHYMVTGAAPSSLGDGNDAAGNPVLASAGKKYVGGNSGPTAAGELIYEDFRAVEERARELMQRSLEFREDISPYRESATFDELVRKFDAASGDITESSLPYTDKVTGQSMSLGERINQADRELRQARDLYAYLLTFAPQARFYSDSSHYRLLCGKTENPNPPDRAYTGLVQDPIIDWCNFRARLRQAVRESVNIRMIYGQEFMVDALSLHFSGTEFVGGEKFVRQEVAKLRAADHQYQEAEIGLQEAITHTIGSGCVVADYFTQTEWALLSKAAESQETAQHEIAVRQSYLGADTANGLQVARAQAGDTFRKAAIEGHAKMVRMAAMMQYPTAGFGCGQGSAPDAQLATDMAQTLLETRNRAKDTAEGRNIFGFDVAFTPYRAYYLPETAPDEGLWNEAMSNAEYARTLEKEEVESSRAFDQSQKELRDSILQIKNTLDMEISNQYGCSNTGAADDAAFFDCTTKTKAALMECESYVTQTIDEKTGKLSDDFEKCMARKDDQGEPLIPLSDARQSIFELRSQVLALHGIYLRVKNFDELIRASDQCSAKVKDWLLASGTLETASAVSGSLLTSVAAAVSISDWDVASLPRKNGLVLFAGAADAILKAAAGSVSTMANVQMEDAENTKEVRNMLLDQQALYIDALAAQQGIEAKVVEFEGILGHMDDVINETKRQRGYLAQSPGNDPSYRIIRDSKRMELAKQLNKAGELAYLAARRAEYEYATRLSANRGFRISDIYRARTSTDIITYLKRLRAITNSVASGQTSSALNTTYLKFSVAQDILGLTDAELARRGIPEEKIEAERARLFRKWVAENTVPNNFERPYDGKPALRFSFTTSLLDGAIFSRLIPQGYDRYWLMKVGGIGEPKPSSNGLSLNLVTDQPGLSHQIANVTQSGMTHLKAQSGCIFDYKLVAPAYMLGLDWPTSQNAHEVEAVLNANVNGVHHSAEEGFRTPAFMGRPVSATEWRVIVFTGSPAHTRDMDLQKLTDIQLGVSVTYASRTPGEPTLSQCTRVDY